jgi:hypothetical protein
MSEPLLRFVIFDRNRQRSPLTNQDSQLFALCNAGVNKISLEQHVVLCG